MEKRARAILPLPSRYDGAIKWDEPPQARDLPQKRRNVRVACNKCRQKKLACDAARPACARCRDMGLDCEYVSSSQDQTPAMALKEQLRQLQDEVRQQARTLNRLQSVSSSEASALIQQLEPNASASPTDGISEALLFDVPHDGQLDTNTNAVKEGQDRESDRSSQQLVDLFDLLKSQPEEFAIQVLRCMRQGMTPDAILRTVGGDISGHLTPSFHTTHRGVMPPTRSFLEYELVVQHPNVYQALVPLDVASLDLALLGVKPVRSFGQQPQDDMSGHTLEQTDSSTAIDPQVFTARRPARLNTAVADAIDARLEFIDISQWTNVPVSNGFAAEAIAMYLEMNHPWWAYFNVDLFLDDLVSGGTRFCSRLLVNALLAWSCQSYAHYEPTAARLTTRFLSEASELYMAERFIDSLTTVAATGIMSMTWTTLGKDKIGHSLQCDNAYMAERLGLYASVMGLSNTPNGYDGNYQAAASVTAWGSFNYQMVMSTRYHQEPMAKSKPRFPIPEDTMFSTPRSHRSSLARTHKYVCQFWSIVHDMNCLYYLEKDVTPTSAASIYRRLLAWADGLHGDMKRGEQNPDHVLNLHIWFHTTVIDLFRPFADQQPQPRIIIFNAESASPRSIIAASIDQLKRLIFHYRSNYESAKYSIIWQSGMLYLVNHILHDYTSKEAHFYFLLCMRGYQYLARQMPLVSGIVQGLMTMAIRLGTMVPDEARSLLEEVIGESGRAEEFLSTYPIDLQITASNPSAATMETLAQAFEQTMAQIDGKGPARQEKPEGWKGDVASLYTTLA